MLCTNPFCTCCQQAYLDGLNDGFAFGFRRGYRSGYVAGSVDAACHLDPPAAYRHQINTALAQYPKPIDALAELLPKKRPRRYPCFGVCTCID